MPISDDTARKVQAIMDKAAEIVKRFPGMSQMEAVMCANSTMTINEIIELKERADRIEERQAEADKIEYRLAASRKTMYEKLNK